MIWAFLVAYCGGPGGRSAGPGPSCSCRSGTAAIWLANAARIAALVLIGARWSPSVACGGFHSQAGWLAFLGVGLGLVAASRRSSFFARSPPAPGRDGRDEPDGGVPRAAAGDRGDVDGDRGVLGGLRRGLWAPGPWPAAAAIWHFRREFARAWSGAGRGGACAIGVAAFALWAALEPASADRVAVAGLGAGGACPAGLGLGWSRSG